VEDMIEQRAKSKEQRAKSKEQRIVLEVEQKNETENTNKSNADVSWI
jgi:hypothetical protein